MSEQTHEPVPGSDIQGEPRVYQDEQIDLTGSDSRSLGMQQCPNCGAKNHVSASVCLACGEQLRQRPKKIRCRQCGQQASSSLTICPSCGRELQAAPSRFWTWVVPLGIVILVAILLISRKSGPVSWAGDQADKAVSWVTGMGEEMDPQVTIISASNADTPVLELVSAASENPETTTADGDIADGDTAVSDDTTVVEPPIAETSADETSGNEVAVALLPTDTPAPEPTNTPQPAPSATPAPSETPSPLPTDAPTETPIPTSTEASTKAPTDAPTKQSTSTPTEKPAATTTASAGTGGKVDDGAESEDAADSNLLILQPTATSEGETGEISAATVALVPTATVEPTATVHEYTVLAGDTLLSIAQRFGVSTEALMAANNIAPNEAHALNVGDTLKIVSDDDAPVTQTYTIRPGDTFVTIAGRFGISTAALQAANGFSDEQVRLLSPGKELTIPLDGAGAGSTAVALAPTATSAPTSTSAPTPAPTAIPTATPSPLRLDAPVLRSPENGTVVSCQSSGQLAWEGVAFVTDTDEYTMHLGFVNSLDENGNEGVVWVLKQQRPSNRTSWEMDPDLCGLAPQEFGRQWRWYVEIMDEDGITVSAPSKTWGFSWN